MVFVCFCLFVCFFVMVRGRHTVCLRMVYFEQVLCRCLWFDFDAVSAFFHK